MLRVALNLLQYRKLSTPNMLRLSFRRFVRHSYVLPNISNKIETDVAKPIVCFNGSKKSFRSEGPYLPLLGFVFILANCTRKHKDEEKETSYSLPLFNAARMGDSVAVERLCKNGADPNQRHPLGWTPLHVAAVQGYVDVVKVLLKVITCLLANVCYSSKSYVCVKVVWGKP